jgi:thiol-disulfide isomerase/thioredoxin
MAVCARVRACALLWSVIAAIVSVHAAGPVNYIDLPRLEEIAVDSFAGVRASASSRANDGGGLFRWEEAAVLTDQNRKYAADNVKMMIVAFLAPWCANSQRLAPVLDAVAQAMSAVSREVMVTRVEAPSNPNLCAEFGVDGYPQVFWKVHGRIVPYHGGLNLRSMLTFVMTQTRPAASQVTPTFNATLIQTLHRMVMVNPLLVVGFFEQPNVKNRGRDVNAFIEASTDHRHIPSVYVLVKDDVKNDRDRTAAAFGVKVPGVRLFRRTEDGFRTNGTNLQGRMTATAISDFVKAEAAPPVAVLSAETAKSIFEGDKKEHVLFIGDAAAPPLAGVIAAASTAHRERLNFVVVPPGSSRFLLHFKIATTELPLVAVADLRGADKKKLRRYAGDWDPELVRQFVVDYAEETPAA